MEVTENKDDHYYDWLLVDTQQPDLTCADESGSEPANQYHGWIRWRDEQGPWVYVHTRLSPAVTDQSVSARHAYSDCYSCQIPLQRFAEQIGR